MDLSIPFVSALAIKTFLNVYCINSNIVPVFFTFKRSKIPSLYASKHV